MKSIHNSKNKKILSFENNNSSFFMIHTDAKEDEHPKKFFNLIKNKENTANEISACPNCKKQFQNKQVLNMHMIISLF